jgi:hypothetical protein
MLPNAVQAPAGDDDVASALLSAERGRDGIDVEEPAQRRSQAAAQQTQLPPARQHALGVALGVATGACPPACSMSGCAPIALRGSARFSKLLFE